VLEGKVAIVTGASSGLGAATARSMAAAGAKVAVAARRRDKGEAVVAEITKQGRQAIFIQTDVTKHADVEAMVKRTLDAFGRLDCAVNNAGILGPVRTPVAEIDEAGWDQVMDTNLKAVWLCMKYEIPAMLKHGRGAIVNVASMYGLKPSSVGHAAYCASKYGVIGLTKTAAIDYGQQGIRINALCPSPFHSEIVERGLELTPDLFKGIVRDLSAQNRISEVDEVAGPAVWLCSDAASFINGVALAVDGGDAARSY
jgi:NAD(P)-dependent dehydrogenase (short-subunit alcohol dehydrogenase family)